MNINDLLYKNIFGNYNLVIESDELQQHVKNTQLLCYDENHKKNDLLLNKYYEIMLNGTKIYEGHLTSESIYKVENIPFGFLKYYKIKIVIYDVYLYGDQIDEKLKIQILNIPMSAAELNSIHSEDYESSHGSYHKIEQMYVLPWKSYEGDTDNQLKIVAGMGGTSKYKENDEFIEAYTKASNIKYYDKLKIVSLSYLDKDDNYNELVKYFNLYSSSNGIYMLVNETDPSHEIIIMETYKDILKIKNNVANYKFVGIDAVTNIEIMGDCKLKKILLFTKLSIGTVEMKEVQIRKVDFILVNGKYKIVDLNDDNHLAIIGSAIDVEYKFYFEHVNFAWIKLTRCFYDSCIRKQTAMSYFTGKPISISMLNTYAALSTKKFANVN